MTSEIKEVFKNIERHLKNISISLRVMEEQGRDNGIPRRDYGEIPASIRKLKECYNFGETDLSADYITSSSQDTQSPPK